MPNMFVNPSPSATIPEFTVWFDFPVPKSETDGTYFAPSTRPNYKLGIPGIELEYGFDDDGDGVKGLGTPDRHQGYPAIYEADKHPFDPFKQDQIICCNTDVHFEHTARLSGAMVKLLEGPQNSSRIRMIAHPITPGTDVAPVVLLDISPNLEAVTPEANKWFWGGQDPASKRELICTAQASWQPDTDTDVVNNTAKLQNETLYKLAVTWEIYDEDGKRMGISGFNDGLDFQVVSPNFIEAVPLRK
jgi:hypothetical protein